MPDPTRVGTDSTDNPSGTGTSHTVSHTIHADTDVLVVCAGFQRTGPTSTVTGVTVDGNAMSILCQATNTSGGQGVCIAWMASDDANWPGSGTYDVVVSYGHAVTRHTACLNYQDVDLTDVWGDDTGETATGSSTNPTDTITSDTDATVISCFGFYNVDPSAESGTRIWYDDNGAAAMSFQVQEQAGTSGTNTAELTLDGSSNWAAALGTLNGDTGGAATISPTGIASGETFGSQVLTTGAVSVSPTGIASGEAFGSSTLSSIVQVLPTAIASLEAFGSGTITVGPVNVSPSSIASLEAFGTVVLSSEVTLSPSGIATAEAFGTAALQFDQTITAIAIVSSEAFGSAQVGDQIAVVIHRNGFLTLSRFM